VLHGVDSTASMQPPLPVGGDTPGGSWRRLIQWMMVWRRKLRAVIELLVPVVVEPMFPGFETGDQRMPSGFGVGGGVLARGLVTAANVAALGAPAQVKPPSVALLALHTPSAVGRDSGVDACVFPHQSHETRRRRPAQLVLGKTFGTGSE
jgi:hypothetical protein